MAPECGRPCTGAQMLACNTCDIVTWLRDLAPPRMYPSEEEKEAACERMGVWHRKRSSNMEKVLTERPHTNTGTSSVSGLITRADHKQNDPKTGISAATCPSAVPNPDTSLHQAPFPRSTSPGRITPPVEHDDEAMPRSTIPSNTKTPLWRCTSSSRCILSPAKTEGTTTAAKP
jgi:hypothetical protein